MLRWDNQLYQGEVTVCKELYQLSNTFHDLNTEQPHDSQAGEDPDLLSSYLS